jgi:hypothetical protein
VNLKCGFENLKIARFSVSTHIDTILTPILFLDYRFEDCGFLVSASCVKSSNPHSLYSSEKGIKLGIRS